MNPLSKLLRKKVSAPSGVNFTFQIQNQLSSEFTVTEVTGFTLNTSLPPGGVTQGSALFTSSATNTTNNLNFTLTVTGGGNSTSISLNKNDIFISGYGDITDQRVFNFSTTITNTDVIKIFLSPGG
jgi:hypothetical protein